MCEAARPRGSIDPARPVQGERRPYRGTAFFVNDSGMSRTRIGQSGRATILPAAPASARPSGNDPWRLPRPVLAAMVEAGDEVRECHRVLAKTGDNVVGEILRDQGVFYEWTHYPEGDVYDFDSHSQYYYHAHPAGERPGEHGHFHTFMRPRGMPKGVAPAPVPGYVPPVNSNDALGHLVAVSMDDKGAAIQLFTTNRWVTGETWYAARDVIAMLDHFSIDLARPSWPVNRWITALLRLFRPQIEALLWERDRVVAAWGRRYPGTEVLEDRRLEVTSKIDISVDDQIRRLSAALKRARH